MMPTNRNIIKRIVFFFFLFSFFFRSIGQRMESEAVTRQGRRYPPVSVGSISLCSTLVENNNTRILRILRENWQTSPGIVDTRNFFLILFLFPWTRKQVIDYTHYKTLKVYYSTQLCSRFL